MEPAVEAVVERIAAGAPPVGRRRRYRPHATPNGVVAPPSTRRPRAGEPQPMSLVELQAVIPIFIVVADGADHARRRGVPRPRRAAAARHPRPHRPGRRGRRVGDAVGPQPGQLRRRPRRQLRACSSTCMLIAVGILTILFSGDLIEREELPAGEYYTLVLFSLVRHDADGHGDRSAGRLPGARDPVARRLRPHRASGAAAWPAPRRLQVLPARRVLERVLPLRHRADLRRHRQHRLDRIAHAPSPASRSAPTRCSSWSRSACCWSASPSRCRRCRSTCGRRTPTRARRRSSPASCRPASRRRRSPRSCACS